MTIRKPYDATAVTPHPHSNDKVVKFKLSRDEKGNCIYRKVDEYSLTDYIQSFNKGCSLTSLLERCSLMPTRDKLVALQRCENSVSVDLSNLPTDLTDAFKKVEQFSKERPELMQRLRSGESISSIITDLAKSAKPNIEKEFNDNGEIKPSNE